MVVASNRGPVSFDRDDRGQVGGPSRLRRAGNGAVRGVLPGRHDLGVLGHDRGRPRGGVEGPHGAPDSNQRMRYVVMPQERYDGYYNEISNRILWFVHHALWDIPRSPMFDDATEAAWYDYIETNRAFANALADEAEHDPVYLIQDYHLSLVPGMLRELVPEAKIVHFSHTPFAGATYLRVLPVGMRTALLRGLAGADVLGFQLQTMGRELPAVGAEPAEFHVLRGGRMQIEERDAAVRAFRSAVSAEPLRERRPNPRPKRALGTPRPRG